MLGKWLVILADALNGEAARLIPADLQTTVETSIVDCISSISANGAKTREMAILIAFGGMVGCA